MLGRYTTMEGSMRLFSLGQIVATPGALRAIQRNTGAAALDTAVLASAFLERHASGDWGEMDDHDEHVNIEALELGHTLLSVYPLADGTRIWILTEADRSVTTILLPEEY